MKKNIQSVVVIFFVTLAFLLMVNDITNNKDPEYQKSAELYKATGKSKIATTDLEAGE